MWYYMKVVKIVVKKGWLFLQPSVCNHGTWVCLELKCLQKWSASSNVTLTDLGKRIFLATSVCLVWAAKRTGDSTQYMCTGFEVPDLLNGDSRVRFLESGFSPSHFSQAVFSFFSFFFWTFQIVGIVFRQRNYLILSSLCLFFSLSLSLSLLASKLPNGIHPHLSSPFQSTCIIWFLTVYTYVAI